MSQCKQERGLTKLSIWTQVVAEGKQNFADLHLCLTLRGKLQKKKGSTGKTG
jgi:hypothetical protein